MLERMMPWTRPRSLTRHVVPRPMSFFGNEMDRLFDDWLLRDNPVESLEMFAPRIDMRETEDSFIVIADLPGLGEHDVDIELEADRVILQGKREEDRVEKNETLYRRERHFGSFQREIMLPWKVEPNKAKVEAVVENGVLTLTIPRPDEVLASRRRIAVEVH